MSKSLNTRCIRRWEVEFKGLCDSKVSPWWRKRDLRGYIRECALTTADCMVENLAYNNAMHDFFVENGDDRGWSPEFSVWYDSSRREQYRKEALSYLNEEASNDEIDEEIQNELEAWND
ncbi:hypothetical protein ABDI71_001857 [Enterobacter hormaechei subsp. hoffmannii]|uniref:hypothetical protein n=1 Tax=Enterobacter hormaechei TaxID=158836 RepID=UPI002860B90E|nr:hypothetical protein [Enterobacter hormaechei]MDU3498072.1 hypothetical protein [Enterobacter hormaechei]